MFKLQITLDPHSPRQKINDRLLLDPLHFSLPSTFKVSILSIGGSPTSNLLEQWRHTTDNESHSLEMWRLVMEP